MNWRNLGSGLKRWAKSQRKMSDEMIKKRRAIQTCFWKVACFLERIFNWCLREDSDSLESCERPFWSDRML